MFHTVVVMFTACLHIDQTMPNITKHHERLPYGPHVTVDYLPVAIGSHSVMFTIRLHIDQNYAQHHKAP